MTFRDDHEAALSRAHALETELERQRAKAECASMQLAEVVAERDQLRDLLGAEINRIPDILESPGDAVKLPASEGDSKTVIVIVIATLITIMFIGVLMAVSLVF